jgi:hypothetical protein
MNAIFTETIETTVPQGNRTHHEAQRIVAQHPLFRGRADAFEFVVCDEVLLVYGQVPSYYLKQILQTVLREVAEISRIDNRVDVVCSNGLSSVRRR